MHVIACFGMKNIGFATVFLAEAEVSEREILEEHYNENMSWKYEGILVVREGYGR